MAALTAMFGLVATAAWAAANQSGGGNGIGGTDEVVLIAEVLLLLLVGRGLGEAMQRIGQPAVVGNLLAGLILGPSMFGWVWPQAHDLIFPKTPEQQGLIKGLSDMGVLMLLLLTGMETDLKLVRKVGAPAIAVTVLGVAVPLACGFAAGYYLPASILPSQASRLITALFLGIALSISSIKIVAMVVREMKFMRRNLGQIIVASAIMEDTAGWILISLALGIAGAGGLALGSLAISILGTAVFLALSYTIGRRLVFWLIRWVNDTFESEYAVVTAILIVMCLLALVTQGIGVNSVLGAFVAGVLVGESPILSEHIQNQLRGFITAFMMPIFFGLSGLSADLTILKNMNLVLLTLLLVAIASIGKFVGAFAGGKLSKLSNAESLALGCGMNARGSTEVIVASIGLSLGVLNQSLYTMIVVMAVITTMAMPPTLRWALKRLPLRKEEKERLEKEDLDARGFVSRLDRLLVAADESPSGVLASGFAGFIAGQRGKPVTVLQIKRKKPKAPDKNPPLKEEATLGAKEGHRIAQHELGEERPERAEISAQVESEAAEAIAREADKGFDLLFLGVEKMHEKDGGFTIAVDRAAKSFEGPLVLVIAGKDFDSSKGENLSILVPVNGTEASRRGAEVALALSPSRSSRITALHVADRSGRADRKGGRRSRKNVERAVLDDLARLAERYGYAEIGVAVHTDMAPDDAILAEAKSVEADIIVIGAARRVGDKFYLGQTVSRVLQKWTGAIVLVAT